MVVKASLRAKLILKSCQSRDPKLLTRAFCVFVRPILEYASVILNPHYKNQITKIEGVGPYGTALFLEKTSGPMVTSISQ